VRIPVSSDPVVNYVWLLVIGIGILGVVVALLTST
jgi:hypothetical protein